MAGFLETLRLAQSGDASSLSELISQFQADVRGSSYDVQIEGADLSRSDLQQEVWLRVWCKLDQFVGSPDEAVCRVMFRRWLRTTSRRVILNVMQARRAERRRPPRTPLSLDQFDGHSGRDPEDSDTPSRGIMEQEEVARVRAAIAAIPCPQSRRIIEMRYADGKSQREIALELTLSNEQVRAVLGRFLAAVSPQE
jgi:RNA polymerase sigma factor (sigma-70 family)